MSFLPVGSSPEGAAAAVALLRGGDVFNVAAAAAAGLFSPTTSSLEPALLAVRRLRVRLLGELMAMVVQVVICMDVVAADGCDRIGCGAVSLFSK